MPKNNDKKQNQLGMPIGTASARLKKSIMFSLAKECNRLNCYRCGKEIESVDDFTIDHKIAWLDNDISLYWDVNNIAFSHYFCNVSVSRKVEKTAKHGSAKCYERGCRCDECKDWKSKANKRQRNQPER